MNHLHHVEEHFTAGPTVRDVVIGMSDGLTVPFALAAGLTGAIASPRIVITAGLAEIAAGSIAKVFYPVFPPDRNAADVLAWLAAEAA